MLRLKIALLASMVWGLIGAGCEDESASTDNTTAFGADRTMMVDALPPDQKRAYCQWILEKLGGAANTVSCPVTDEQGNPVLDPDEGGQLNNTFYISSIEECTAQETYSYPCTAGLVSDCFESYLHDWCNPNPPSTPECESLNRCLVASPPPNNAACVVSCGSLKMQCKCSSSDPFFFCNDDSAAFKSCNSVYKGKATCAPCT